MLEEIEALHKNHTWTLVSPPNANIIGSKWFITQNLCNMVLWIDSRLTLLTKVTLKFRAWTLVKISAPL